MPVNEEQKISILIAEYNSLRSETVTRTGHGFQIAGFSITALSIWAAEETSGRTWLALTAIILLLVASGWFTFREITKANRRIRDDRALMSIIAQAKTCSFGRIYGKA